MVKKKSSYYEQVYEITKNIPFGRVTTYGAIADYLCLGSARMVGYALNKSSSYGFIPAHRVVNRRGELSGRNSFATPTLMQELLENEGLHVQNDRIVNFHKFFWHPQELDM